MIHKICRGSAPVPTPDREGQPRGDCPYKNYTNDLGLLYQLSTDNFQLTTINSQLSTLNSQLTALKFSKP
jgi:hypothetical protein